MLKIKIHQFEGPLDLLLELIEDQKLDITEVSLATVADQFLSTLKEVETKNPDELADFLVVAAKLLLIKSRVLLPYLTLDEDDDGRDLERQLKMYKLYYDAAKVLRKIWRRQPVLYPREQLPPVPVFTPPDGLTVDDLRSSFATLLAKLEPIVRIPRDVLVRTVNLQHKINSIRERLLSEASINFSRLVAESQNRLDVIVTFLALLELVKQRTIAVVQDTQFQEIAITRVEVEAPAEVTV